MVHPSQTDLRELILTVASEQEPKNQIAPPLQQGSVLQVVAQRLGGSGDAELQRAILTQWHDLFRTGYFAWGFNLSNPNPPFFHFTDPGRRVIERLGRDPGNPSGYLRHLGSVSRINPIANSYLTEGLNCYAAGFYKAAAVMIGAAAESLILELRDVTTQKLVQLQQSVPKGLTDWRVKTVLNSLHSFLESRKSGFPRELQEEFEAYWLAFAQQIRATRNDAGHPSSVDPVTEEGVHASYLILPELARLCANLGQWMTNNLK